MAHPDVSWYHLGPWDLETWCNGNVSSHCKVDAGTWMGAQFFGLFHQWTRIRCWRDGDAHYDALSHEHSATIAQYGAVLHPSREFSCSDGRSSSSSCWRFVTQSSCCAWTFLRCSSTNTGETIWTTRCKTPQFQGYAHHYRWWCIAEGVEQRKHVGCPPQIGN